MRVLGAAATFFSAALFAMVACGGRVSVSATDHLDGGVSRGGSNPGPYGRTENHPEVDRVTYHGGAVLRDVRLAVVYLGDSAAIAESRENFVRWLFGSLWWATLRQYEVSSSRLVGSVRLPTSDFATPLELAESGGLIDSAVFKDRLRGVLERADVQQRLEGLGVNAYLVFLPEGMQISFGTSGSKTQRTCVDAWSYHGYDGAEPFALMPPCELGRSPWAISHELAETVTNPEMQGGYYSDEDSRRGGEIADFCYGKPSEGGYELAQVWSNEDGQCMPRPEVAANSEGP